MIIGLSGYAGSGKDAVAQYLVDTHGYTRVAFADAIRDFVYEFNPTITLGYDTTTNIQLMVDHGGWDEAKQNLQVRELLQKIGVAARNQFGELFWVKMALNKVSYTEIGRAHV